MTDFKQEVPALLVKLVGHVCGLVFVFLAFFSSAATYILFLNFSFGPILLLLISIALTWFFGRTALRLNSCKPKNIISRNGILAITAGFGVLSLLAFAIILMRYTNKEIGAFQMLSLTLLSGAAALFSYLVFRYVRRNF